MGLFDFFKKKNTGIEAAKFNSEQFQNEICALAMWKLEENNGNPNIAIEQLKEVGLNDEQIQLVLKRANQIIQFQKQSNSNQIGIPDNVFKSDKFQKEILDNSFELYFKSKHNYEIVEQDLTKQGLNNYQIQEILAKLKMRINEMVDSFQSELDSGVISGIKVIPNTEHTKDNVDTDQVDQYIGFGAYQMDRGDLDNALELFDKAIELDKNATLAYANKGTLYAKKDDKNKALEFYNKALEIEPNHVQILETKMNLLFEILNESNEKELIDTVKRILSNNPIHPNALVCIIQVYLKENDLDNALISVKKLFANFHTENVAVQFLLDIFHKLSNERALNEFVVFKNEINNDASYQLDYCKGLYLMDMGDYENSISTFEELNKEQEFSWNYYQIAILKNFQKKTDECLSFLKKTFELEPGLKEDAKQLPYLENLFADRTFIEITK